MHSGGEQQTEPKAGQQTAEQRELEEVQEIVKKTGFVEQDGGLYYYDSNGEPVTGWFEENGSRYYAGLERGVFRDGQFVINGTKHYFDENGVYLGDEDSYAREDANLLESVTSGDLKDLMDAIAYRYIGEGDTKYFPRSSDDVQKEINSLLHGEQAGIDSFFAGDMPAAGDIGWGEIGNATMKRVDYNTWKVQLDVFYGFGDIQDYDHEVMDFVANIDFTVIKNPESRFDGFSITDAEVKLVENVDAWMWLYNDYLGSSSNDSVRYQLFYMDDNNIPEMFVWDVDAGEAVILNVDNKKEELYSSEAFQFLTTNYDVFYVERQNFVDISYSGNSEQGIEGGVAFGFDYIYRIADKAACQAEGGNYEYWYSYTADYDTIGIGEIYRWDDENISEDMYDSLTRKNEVVTLLDFNNGYSCEDMKGILNNSTSEIRQFMKNENN